MLVFNFFEKNNFPDFFKHYIGQFRTQKLPKRLLRKSGKCCLNKKIKVTIQPGIQKAPMQALAALCRTKIVAATVIQRQAGFGVKIAKLLV